MAVRTRREVASVRVARLLGSVAVTCTVAGPGVASAANLTLTPFVSAKAEYDDNVFRRSDDGGDGRSDDDTITTYTAGFDSTYAVSLQQFYLRGAARTVNYDKNKDIDYDGYGVDGGMNWQVGSLMRGTLSAGRYREQEDFSDRVDGLEAEDKALVTTTTGAFSANVRVLSDFELRTRLGSSRIRHSIEESEQQDSDEDSGALGISYIGPARGTIGIEAVLAEGEYVEREPLAGSVEEYEQVTVQLVGTWQISGITQLRYSLGSTKRDNKGVDVDDDTGFVGDLYVSRSVSGKTNLYAGAYRTVASAEAQGENSVTSTGLNVGGSWTPIQRINLSGNVIVQQDDFEESTQAGGDSRKDDVMSVGASLAYTPREWLEITPSAAWEDRKSDLDSGDYDSYQVRLEVKLLFPLAR